MAGRKTVTAAVLITLATAACAAILILRHRHNDCDDVTVPPLPFSELRDGDLAFRTGRGNYSTILSMKKHHPDTIYFSHTGLVVDIGGGRWRVIHAVPNEPEFKGDADRVKMETLEEFFAPRKASHGALIHTGTVFPRHLVDTAISYVDRKVRFDSQYMLSDSSKLYCTEFIWRLYKKTGIDLSEGRRSFDFIPIFSEPVIQPSDLWLYSKKEKYFYY